MFTFIQMADPHLSGNGYHDLSGEYVIQNFRQAVEEINGLKPAPAFIIVSGDLVESGRTEEYEIYRAIAGQLKCPVYNLAGNHETIEGGFADFEKYAGKLCQSFEHDHCQFILLNGALDQRKYSSAARYAPEQISWLRTELKKSKAKLHPIVVSHFPLEEKWGAVGTAGPEREELLGLLAEYKVPLFIFGHRHGHDYSERNGTAHVLCGSVGWNFQKKPVGYRSYQVHPEYIMSDWKNTGGNIDGNLGYCIKNLRRGHWVNSWRM